MKVVWQWLLPSFKDSLTSYCWECASFSKPCLSVLIFYLWQPLLLSRYVLLSLYLQQRGLPCLCVDPPALDHGLIYSISSAITVGF